jgi:hypothetical protein
MAFGKRASETGDQLVYVATIVNKGEKRVRVRRMSITFWSARSFAALRRSNQHGPYPRFGKRK